MSLASEWTLKVMCSHVHANNYFFHLHSFFFKFPHEKIPECQSSDMNGKLCIWVKRLHYLDKCLFPQQIVEILPFFSEYGIHTNDSCTVCLPSEFLASYFIRPLVSRHFQSPNFSIVISYNTVLLSIFKYPSPPTQFM